MPAALRAMVAERLFDQGWQPFQFGAPSDVIYTRDVGGGFTAMGSVGRSGGGGVLLGPGMGRREPGEWSAVIGAGYARALDLFPRLTLVPRPALAFRSLPIDLPQDAHTERSDAAVAGWADQVAEVFGAATDFARGLTSIGAMEAELRQHGNGEFAADGELDEELVVFLAASGRVEEAVELSASVLGSPERVPWRRAEVRFARQLKLWAQTGAPQPPPLAQWPVEAFALPVPPTPRPAGERRAESQLRRDAYDEVRRSARGRSRSEVAALLETALRGRGLAVDPVSIGMVAQMLVVETQPLGKWRAKAMAAGTALRLARDAVTAFSGRDDEGRWPEPPDDALFEVPLVPRTWIPVELSAPPPQWAQILSARARLVSTGRLGSARLARTSQSTSGPRK